MIERLKYLYRAYKYKYVKDSNEIDFALKHIQKGDTIVDIGCHKGAYLYWFEKATGKKSQLRLRKKAVVNERKSWRNSAFVCSE